MTTTLQIQLTDELVEYLKKRSGDGTFYTSPEDYLISMIRERAEVEEGIRFRQAVREGVEDLIAGRTIEFSGSISDAIAEMHRRDREGW
jgi:hypothetical protein